MVVSFVEAGIRSSRDQAVSGLAFVDPKATPASLLTAGPPSPGTSMVRISTMTRTTPSGSRP